MLTGKELRMALKLTKNNVLDFSGKAGDEVLLDLRAPAGVLASILGTSYGGVTNTTPPFKITLTKGDKGLVVLYAASVDGAQLSVVEVDQADPTNTQVLGQPFFHQSIPHVTILIRCP
jgi:hypothetical protein